MCVLKTYKCTTHAHMVPWKVRRYKHSRELSNTGNLATTTTTQCGKQNNNNVILSTLPRNCIHQGPAFQPSTPTTTTRHPPRFAFTFFKLRHKQRKTTRARPRTYATHAENASNRYVKKKNTEKWGTPMGDPWTDMPCWRIVLGSELVLQNRI